MRVSGGSTATTFLADSAGIKQSNRGEWVRKKRKVRRGFVKLHMLVDADAKKIPAVAVADDRTGDSPVLRDLLGAVMESPDAGQQDGKLQDGKLQDGKGRRIAIISAGKPASKDQPPRAKHHPANTLAQGVSPLALPCSSEPASHGACLLADGAHASRANMQMCQGMGVRPLIPVQTRCTALGKGTGDAWGLAVRDQIGGSMKTSIDGIKAEEREENKKRWKSRVGYGRRWLIEIIISAFKRMFGDHVQSRKWEHMVQEIKLKVALYNRWVEATAM